MDEQIKIIHITDLHFYKFPASILKLLNKRILGCLNWELNRKRRFDFNNTGRFINFLKKQNNAVVLITGDLTVTAHEEEFYIAKEFLNKIRATGHRLFVIPGNHDYYTFECVKKKRFETLLSDYCLTDDYPIVVKLPNGIPIIFLHTVRPNILSSRGEIDKEQIEKLNEIISSLHTPAVVCSHYPVLHHTPEYYSSYSRRLKNADLLRQTITQTRVPLLYVAGHVHHYSLTQDKNNPLVQYLCSPAFFYNQKRGGGFSIITLKEDTFSIAFQSLYNIKEDKDV